jgi:cation diffusion facilitator CzcD-associated flavoprotein CzcO
MHTTALPTSARIAVIGGGPAGIATAKELIERGFAVTVLEASDDLGGQWSAGAAHSGIWPGMRANTSGPMTRFSQRPTPASWPLFPTAGQVADELRAYAAHHGVALRTRTRARVVSARQQGSGWVLDVEDTASGRLDLVRADAVVAASGRFGAPHIPADLAFAPRVDVIHASAYRGPGRFAGKRVLVVGNSISGVEIAADLAHDPSITVVSSARRGRWIIPKVAAGAPADQVWFTAFAALLGRSLPPEALADGLRAQLEQAAGDPAAVGGLMPHPDLLATGLSQSQHYLPLVAEGRIAVRPGIAEVAGDVVRFTDGSEATVDAVVLATGYAPDLPYLAAQPEALDTLTFDAQRPGLAVVGQYVVHGPALPVIELQARLVAAVWAGERSLLDCPPLPALPHYPHHMLAEAFAAGAGAAPDEDAHPALVDALRFGPMLPERYRLGEPGMAERFAVLTAGFRAPDDQQAAWSALTAEQVVATAA